MTSFILYIRSADASDNFIPIRTLNSSDLMMAGENFLYNVSDGALIYPERGYSFTVISCNLIGCSNQSQPSPAAQTLKDGMKVPNKDWWYDYFCFSVWFVHTLFILYALFNFSPIHLAIMVQLIFMVNLHCAHNPLCTFSTATLLIQLRLVGVSRCQDWVVSEHERCFFLRALNITNFTVFSSG